jgi:diguanylate cyclase
MTLISGLVRRTEGDLRLATVVAVAVIVIVCLLPFAAYRAATGQWGPAAVDLALMAGVAAIAGFGWRRRDASTVAPVLALFVSIGCVAAGEIIGITSMFWTPAALLGNYLLLPRRPAMALSLAVVAGQALLYHDHLPGLLSAASFVVTSLMVLGAAHVAASLVDAQRLALEGQASRDPLTGVDNRRAMEQALTAITVADGAGTLALLDLDHFKRVNDLHGHDAGDAVLVRFAQIVRATVRRSDRFFRIGGEEFVLLLPEVDRAGTRRALEKVLGEVRAALRSPGGAVTVSIGAAERRPGETASQWLARADAALYEVKHHGRDGLAFARDPQTPADTWVAPPSRL